MQQNGFTISNEGKENEPTVSGPAGPEHQYQLTTAWPGHVSCADNRLSHQQLTPGPEKTETDEKRRRQLVFSVLSGVEFSSAKSLVHNSLQSSRRQPYFYSILKENRQFRL
jgi:hypothetical protein